MITNLNDFRKSKLNESNQPSVGSKIDVINNDMEGEIEEPGCTITEVLGPDMAVVTLSSDPTLKCKVQLKEGRWEIIEDINENATSTKTYVLSDSLKFKKNSDGSSSLKQYGSSNPIAIFMVKEETDALLNALLGKSKDPIIGKEDNQSQTNAVETRYDGVVDKGDIFEVKYDKKMLLRNGFSYFDVNKIDDTGTVKVNGAKEWWVTFTDIDKKVRFEKLSIVPFINMIVKKVEQK